MLDKVIRIDYMVILLFCHKHFKQSKSTIPIKKSYFCCL